MTRRITGAMGLAAFLLACGPGTRAGPDGKAWNHPPSTRLEGACPSGYINDPIQGCINLQTDPNNCGAVGNVCTAENDPCYQGKCIAECPCEPNTITDCNGACIDIDQDFYNCGACGNSCTDGQVCNGGTCETLCDPVDCPAPPVNASSVCRKDNSCGFTCNPGYALGADGKSCVKSCTPATCATAGANCGVISNGCGAFLSCGSCAAPLTCGGGGTANVCGAPPTKRVFVTSLTYNGNLGGLDGADAKCQALATAAALGGTYKAWLSTVVLNARDRLTHATMPYTLVDGAVVAANFTQLTSGTLLHAINKTQTNGAPPASAPLCSSTQVWTDTTAAGNADLGDCEGWTIASSTTGTAFLGDYTQTNSTWSRHCFTHFQCDKFMPLYCIEQ